LQQARSTIRQRESLQDRLARAVEEENYELAAKLRDEIKELEKESAA
jgi:protein-arginine kinase activator protein McsA